MLQKIINAVAAAVALIFVLAAVVGTAFHFYFRAAIAGGGFRLHVYWPLVAMVLVLAAVCGGALAARFFRGKK